MFGHLGWQEMVLILFVAVLLFGVSGLPRAMRSFGRGYKELKKGMKEIEPDLDLLRGEDKKG